MGTLRSLTDHTGMTVNKVLLGQPVETDGNPDTFEWDDSAFPNGEIMADGTVVVSEDN